MKAAPLEDCDLVVSSATPSLILKGYKSVTKRMVELDKEMIDGLKGIGFKHDIGEDQTGHQMKYFRRGGGYNLGRRQFRADDQGRDRAVCSSTGSSGFSPTALC